jgi:hypothetical protein
MDTDVVQMIFRKGSDMGDRDGRHWNSRGGSGGLLYFLGLIGAAVFYIQQANDFWGGVVGFLKAIVWPAFVIYDALKFMAS